MGEFFFMLIGYFVFLIINYNRAVKIGNLNCFYQEDRKEYTLSNHKPVWFYGVEQGKPIYIETSTNKKIYKGIDNFGFNRWFYIENNKPMTYVYNEQLQNKLKINSTKAKAINKNWCVVENFWDDSIIKLKDNIGISNTYLDDYRSKEDPFQILAWNEYARNWNKANPNKRPKQIIDIRNNSDMLYFSIASPKEKELCKQYFYYNNPLNQKIYLKNMRPYQLYLLGESKTGSDNEPIVKKQYLIRFGKPNYFNFKTQHCIYDKQISDFWSKWYAITEQQYLDLTITNDGINNNSYNNPLNTKTALRMCLRPIKLIDIAFLDNIDNVKWNMINCGIKAAFDNEGNFIGK